MARRDVTAFLAELLLKLANRTDITTAMRVHFLNDALRSIGATFKHPELEDTGTGTLLLNTDSFTITLVSGGAVWWPELVQDTTTTPKRTLKPGDKDQIEDRDKPASNPYKYYWWGNVFYTDAKPTTSHTMKVWAVRQIVDFDPQDPTETSPLNQIYDPLIIMTAAYIGLSTVRDYEEASRQLSQARQYVQEQKLPFREAKKDDRSTGIQVRFR